MEVARRAGLPLNEIEYLVLDGVDRGWLTYHPSGRDLLLELLPAQRCVRPGRRAPGALRNGPGAACGRDHGLCPDRAMPPRLSQRLPGRSRDRALRRVRQLRRRCQQAARQLRCPTSANNCWTILRCVQTQVVGARQPDVHPARRQTGPAQCARNHPAWGALAFRSETAVGQCWIASKASGFCGRGLSTAARCSS